MAKKRTAPKRARPRKRHPFSERIGVAVKPAQKDAYLAASDAEGMDLSDWIRRTLDRRVAELSQDGG